MLKNGEEEAKVLREINARIPALIIVFNINTGEYTYVNEAIKKILGFTPEDFTSKGMPFVNSLVHPDDIGKIIKKNSKALEDANAKGSARPDDDPIVNFEYRMKHKDGSWRWLHTDASVFERSSDGRVEQILNISIDITKRKEAEIELAELSKSLDSRIKNKTKELLQMQDDIRISEKRHRTMIEQSPLSTQILSPDGWTLQVNKAWEELWGAKLEHMKDYNMLEDKQLVELGIMPYIKKGFQGEPTLIPAVKYQPQKTLPDATEVPYRWVSAMIYPVKDEHGDIREVVLIHQDITEQKDAAEKVMQSEQQLQAIMDESPAVIFLKDIEGKYLLINRKFEQLFGITRDEVRGKTDYEMFPKETADQVVGHDKKVLATGKPLEIEEIVPHKDGPHTYISIKFPLYAPTGKPYAVCGIATDISERKLTEQRKEDFISVASHELKTPVTSAKIFTQILERRFEQLKDEKSLDTVRKMDKQMNKLTMLIRDLLDLAKINTERFEFRKEFFEVDSLIKETVESLHEISGRHKIIMSAPIQKKIYADRDRIEQVLINLLTNATKYSPEADKIIVQSEKDKDSVTISIQDFGIGIPKKAHKKIFERFFRVEGESEKTYPGFGIGLYVSAEIIKRHGGKIWVESKHGKGTTFYFTLPIQTKE